MKAKVSDEIKEKLFFWQFDDLHNGISFIHFAISNVCHEDEQIKTFKDFSLILLDYGFTGYSIKSQLYFNNKTLYLNSNESKN
jgi:hypothetical protein